MNGRVDGSGRALIKIALKPSAKGLPMRLEAWVDTGFTGELVLPQTLVSDLKLQSGTVGAQLGDGSDVILRTYTCRIAWFGKSRQIEVVANDGQFPLLGVGLLRDHRMAIDYPAQSVVVE